MLWIAVTLALLSEPLKDPESAPAPDFAWLSGAWARMGETERSEEIWSAADGTVMTGMNRTLREGRPTAFEFMRIELGPAPAFIAQPCGGPPVRFTLIDHGPNQALFANLDHDFPTHIAYARQGDVLTARIWGARGETEAIIWRWTPRGA